eukprot:434175_1
MKQLTRVLQGKYSYHIGQNVALENPNDILKYLCSNSYTRIFFVRDPLARLLSGYLNKCTNTSLSWIGYGYYHEPCEIYLNESAIKFNITVADFITSKQNTFFEFINWISLQTQSHKHINGHFSLFSDETSPLIARNWKFVDIKNTNVWTMILKSILTKQQFESEFIVNKRLTEWSIFCENELRKYNVSIADTHGYKGSSTNADLKLKGYYSNIFILYNALLRLKTDYTQFRFTFPSWICDLFFHSNHGIIETNVVKITLDLIYNKSNQHQIPNCLNEIAYMVQNSSLINTTSEDLTYSKYVRLKLQIIDLMDTKYNFSKQIDVMKHINISNVTTLLETTGKYVEECIRGIHYHQHDFRGILCEINNELNNISFVVHNSLGMGWQSSVYNVSVSIGGNTTNESYILKILHQPKELLYNIGSGGLCYVYEREYKLLKKIEMYGKLYNISPVAISYVNSKIPVFKTGQTCLIFTQQVKHALSLHDLMTLHQIETSNILHSIISVKGDIINFLIDCYNDIMNVFKIMYEFGTYHRDIKSENILIDTQTFNCYVIDFGILFEESQIFASQNGFSNNYDGHVGNNITFKYQHYFSCKWSICSPIIWHYLRTPIDRIKFVQQVYNTLPYKALQFRKPIIESATKILSKFAIYGLQYAITAHIFHAFVKLYYIQQFTDRLETNVIFQMNNLILQTNNGNSLLGYEDYINTKLAWYTRYQIYCNIMKQIKNETIAMNVKHHTKQTFVDIISIFDDDLLFLNMENCDALT